MKATTDTMKINAEEINAAVAKAETNETAPAETQDKSEVVSSIISVIITIVVGLGLGIGTKMLINHFKDSKVPETPAYERNVGGPIEMPNTAKVVNDIAAPKVTEAYENKTYSCEEKNVDITILSIDEEFVVFNIAYRGDVTNKTPYVATLGKNCPKDLPGDAYSDDAYGIRDNKNNKVVLARPKRYDDGTGDFFIGFYTDLEDMAPFTIDICD